MRFTDLVSVINPLISHPKFKACLVHVNHLFPHPIPRDLKSNTGVCITFNNGIPILHNIPIFRIQLNDNFAAQSVENLLINTSVCCKLITKSFNLVKNLAFLL